MNQLILTKNYTLFLGVNPRPLAPHQHPVIQYVQAIEQPFLTKNKDHSWSAQRALLIPPNFEHQCDARKLSIFTLTIDPESYLGEWIVQFFFPTKQLITDDHPQFPLFDIL